MPRSIAEQKKFQPAKFISINLDMYMEVYQGKSRACAHVRSVHDDQDILRKHARIGTFASSEQNFWDVFYIWTSGMKSTQVLVHVAPEEVLEILHARWSAQSPQWWNVGLDELCPSSTRGLFSWILLCGVQGQVAFWPPHCQSVDLISIVICELE